MCRPSGSATRGFIKSEPKNSLIVTHINPRQHRDDFGAIDVCLVVFALLMTIILIAVSVGLMIPELILTGLVLVTCFRGRVRMVGACILLCMLLLIALPLLLELLVASAIPRPR